MKRMEKDSHTVKYYIALNYFPLQPSLLQPPAGTNISASGKIKEMRKEKQVNICNASTHTHCKRVCC